MNDSYVIISEVKVTMSRFVWLMPSAITVYVQALPTVMYLITATKAEKLCRDYWSSGVFSICCKPFLKNIIESIYLQIILNIYDF